MAMCASVPCLGSSSSSRPWQQHQYLRCTETASSSSASPQMEGLYGATAREGACTVGQQLRRDANISLRLRRRSSRGSYLTRRTESGPRADSEREEGPSGKEVNGRATLNSLDEQLRSLSSSSTVARESSEARGTEGKPLKKGDEKLDWPTFPEGSFVYAGVLLLLITVVNNVLFKIFIGPPVVPHMKSKPQGPVKQRYRLRSYDEIYAPPLVDNPVNIQ